MIGWVVAVHADMATDEWLRESKMVALVGAGRLGGGGDDDGRFVLVTSHNLIMEKS